MSKTSQNDSSSTEILTTENKQPKDMPLNVIGTKKPVIECKWKRRVLVFGFAMAVWTATFTSTAIGSALGQITSDLNDFGNMSWYLTGYCLTTGVFQLLSIRISDCIGRKRTYMFGAISMVVTCVLCAVSVNSYMFIAWRVIEGVSGGLCVTVTTAAIVDLFPLEQRIKYQSNNYAAFGLASSIGPIIAGVFADKLSWRYIFWANAIIGVVLSVIIYLLLEIPTKPEQKISIANLKTLVSRIDLGGCIIVSIAIVGLLLSMEFGSGTLGYDWSSPVVIGILVGSFVMGLIFTVYEKFVALSPLFPSKIITDKTIVLMYIQHFIAGVFNVTLILTPIITSQSVFNDTPTGAALKLLPGVLVFIVFTMAQTKVAKKLKTPKPAIIVGNLLIILSLLLWAFVENEHSSTGVQIGIFVIFTAGFGQTNQSTLIASQIIIQKKASDMIATGLVLIRFLIQVGVTIGAAVFLTMVKSIVKTNLDLLQETAPNVYQNVIASGTDKDYASIRLVGDDLTRGTLNSIYFKSISVSLYVPIAASIIALLCSIFVTIPKMGEEKDNKETKS